MDTALNRLQLDPFLKGTSPLQEFALGKMLSKSIVKPGDLEKMHTLDLLGVNYYTRTVAKYDRKFPVVAASRSSRKGMNIPACGKSIPKGIYEF